jgi:hypothetical protein
MKPYVYTGLDPAIFFWSLIGCTVIMFSLFIYEEHGNKESWGKAGIIRVSIITALWFLALIMQIHTGTEKDGGLETANQNIVKMIEDKGLGVVSGAVDASADKQSIIGVELPLAKDAAKDAQETTENCAIFSPKDTTQDIGIICGTSPNGMSLDNLLKWNEAGQPEDTKAFENTAEDTKKIVESVTAPTKG